MPEPFTFGIPLIARASARNWPLVEALLDRTLVSAWAQMDEDFQVVIAGHEVPRISRCDSRITFLKADWPAEPVRADNLDSGRKKHAINRLVLARGGGLLMFLDADDWVDRRLVATARASIHPNCVGGVIGAGYATDLRRLRAAPIPHPRVFDGEFHRLCGSSIVARLGPTSADPLRGDPYEILHEHYRWIEIARAHGAEPVRLPVHGNYVVNTSHNHSEIDGPFSQWRRCFNAALNREGKAVDHRFLARFGLGFDPVRAVAARFFA